MGYVHDVIWRRLPLVPLADYRFATSKLAWQTRTLRDKVQRCVTVSDWNTIASEVGGWAPGRSRLLLMFEVDRHEDEIRKVRTRCYRRKVRSWAFKLELSFLLSDVVSQSWKLNRIFRHCVVWRWKSMYTRIDVATRSWMLFANIECWHTTLIFGGDCTP